MTQAVRQFPSMTARYTDVLFLLGLIGVAWYNRRLWQRDVAFLKQKTTLASLPPLEEWSRLPKVSVLVAAWNEEAMIERHIQSFTTLRYPHKELVLCAGGEDQTYAMAARWVGNEVIVLVQQPGEGKQRSLRRCLDVASGTIIFLTDADCLLDDEAFERTLYPVASGRERACTGSLRPYSQMTSAPFVVAQAAPKLYSTLHGPPYAPGLLGCNCAIERELLESCQGLDAPAPTGTDYVLAKMIGQTGTQIRHVPESRVATEYPTTVQGYIRQQRRWLRNVALYGRRFGARDEVRASLFTSSVGLGMLVLPLSAVVAGRVSLMIWLVLLLQAFLSRLRYLRFAARIMGFRTSWRQVAVQIPAVLLDFVAWSRPLLDYIVRDSEKVW
ncbi:MAG TPA: glycosyltransferase [Anaerolineae bacterium]